MRKSDSIARLASSVAFLLLPTAVVVVALFPALMNRASPRFDSYHFYAPYFHLVGDFAREGRLLVWNPWVNGGSPDGFDAQVGAFSPVVLMASWMWSDDFLGFANYWFLLWAAAGLGTWLLMRQLGAPRWGCSAAAVAFVASGFFVGHGQHTSMITSLASLPFILWRLNVGMAKGKTRCFAEAGAIWGVAALSGYPGLTVCNALFCAFWVGGRTLFAPRDEPPSAVEAAVSAKGLPWAAVRRNVLGLVLFAAIGVAIASPAYLLFILETQGYSERSGTLARSVAVESNALHPLGVATVVSPYFGLAHLNAGRQAIYTGISSLTMHVPTVALFLALLGLFYQPSRWRWWLAFVGCFFLVAAIGRALPLRGWLYDLLPPFRYFRHASMLRGYWIFAVVSLAAYGARDLLTILDRGDWRQFDRRVLPLWTLVSCGALVGISIAAGRGVFDSLDVSLPGLRACLPWVLTGVGLAVIRLAKPGSRTVSVILLALLVAESTWAVKISQPLNTTVSHRVMQSWRDVQDKRRFEVSPTRLAGQEMIEASTHGVGRDNLNLLTKEPVFESYTPLVSRYHRRWVGNDQLRDLLLQGGRFRFASGGDRGAATKACWDTFERRVERRGSLPLWLHAATPGEDGEVVACARGFHPLREATPRILQDDSVHIKLEFEAAEAGWLFQAERYARGWKARVNGVETEMVLANFLFRAIPVEKGTNEIELQYSVPMLPVLLLISWGSVVVIFAHSALRWRQRAHAVGARA